MNTLSNADNLNANSRASQTSPALTAWVAQTCLLLLLLAPGLAFAEACYIGSDATDELLFLSDNTDASTAVVVGPFGVPDIEAMAKDPVTQELFAANASTLGAVDLDTGAYTTLGSFGTAFAANGDLTADRALDDIDSLGFDPVTRELYGIQSDISSGTGILFQINPANGALIPGALGGNDYLVITGGVIDDLAIDLSGNMFVSLADQLATVDFNAVGTVANVVVGTFGTGITDMEGLSVDIDNNLIGATGSGGTSDRLWTIDKNTGAATQISQPGIPADYESVACYFTPVDIELTKNVALTNDPDGSGFFSTGDDVTYSITVTNTNPAALVSVVEATDDLSGLTGLTFVSASHNKPANSTYDSATGVWSIGVIPPNTTYTLEVVYNVGADAVPVVVNTAQVTAAANSDPDSTPNNDTGNQSEDDEDRAELPLNPELGVTKAASTIGAIQADGTFDVEYTVLVENTGGAQLFNLRLMDELDATAQLGTAFNGIVGAPVVSIVSNASGNAVPPTSAGAAFTGTGSGTGLLAGTDGSLGLSDQFQVVFSVNIDPDAAGAPATLQNTVTATGIPSGGKDVLDDSNTATDASGASTGEVPGDNPGGPGSPTPVTPPTGTPEIGLVKSATTIGPLQGDGTFDVTYTLLIENTGTLNLTPLTLVDDLSAATQLGSAFNGIISAPVVSVANNVSGNAVAPTTSGAAFTGTGTGTALITGSDGRIDPGDQYQVVFSVNIDPNAAGAPTDLDNTATATGTPPSGTPVSDDSNTGTDDKGVPNGELPSDNPGGPGVPTPISPPPVDGEIGITKSATTIGALQGDGTFNVTYTLLIENTGSENLASLTLVDDLSAANQLGSAFNGVTDAPVVSVANNASGNAVAPTSNGPAFTGTGTGTALITGTDGRIDPGDQYQVVFSVNIDPNAAGAPADLNNTATAGGTTPGGTPVSDDSDTGTDETGAGNGETPGNNPGGPGTPTPIAPPGANPSIGVIKSATTIGALSSDGTFDVTYEIVVSNTGNQTLTPLTLVDDLSQADQLGTAFNGVTGAPVVSLSSNSSGNGIAPTTSGGAFTGTGSGTALVLGTDGSLDPGDEYTVTFTVNINPNAAGAPATLQNTATAGGTPPSGTPISDDSDTGTDSSGNDTGTNPGDNPDGPGSPTIVVPPAGNPEIGLVKSVISVGPLQADGSFSVDYQLIVENTGNVTLTNLALSDDLSASDQLGTAFAGIVTAPVVAIANNASGNAVAPTGAGAAFTGTGTGTGLLVGTNGRLDPTDQYSVTFTASVNPTTAGAPEDLTNTATANGDAPNGVTVTDDSNTGTDLSGAPTGENPGDNPGGPGTPTPVSPPTGDGEIGLTKGAIAIGNLNPDGTFDVTYRLLARNTGTATLSALRLTDNLEDPANLGTAFNEVTEPPVVTLVSNATGESVAPISTGAGFTGRAGGIALLTGTASRLAPDDEFAVEFTVNINPNASGAPAIFNNTADVFGTILGTSNEVTDASNTSTDIDGNATGELPTTNPGGPGSPTPVVAPAEDPSIGLAKTASVGGLQADGTFDVTFTLLAENLGNVQLTQLTLTDELSAATNLGSAFVGLRGSPSIRLINTSGNSLAPSLNAGFTGTASAPDLLTGTDGLLIPGDQFEVIFTAIVAADAPGAPAELTNQAVVGGTSPGGAVSSDLSDNGTQASGPNGDGTDNDPTPIAVPVLTPLIISKTTSTPDVSVGDFASFTVTVTNPAAFQVNGVTVSDDLPGGFFYVEESAQLLRAGTTTPASVTGIDPIIIEIGVLDAGESVSITYLSRVGAGVVAGEHTNTATALVFGVVASNTADATVVLGEDPLLTTTRIIGKVWHDRDGDGWQDAAKATGIKLSGGPFGDGKKLEDLPGRMSDSDEGSAPKLRIQVPGSWRNLDQVKLSTAQGSVLYINNQGAIEERHRGQKKRGKTGQNLRVKLVSNRENGRSFKRNDYLEIENLGVNEEGLSGVRLATIEGLVIETDRWGRYHIEEIENVAFDIGSNYIVKVDPQTLPEGAEFTTENPRVVRLTQSLMSDVSFGVQIPQGNWQAYACPAPDTNAVAAAPTATGGVTLRTEPLTVVRFNSGKSEIDVTEIAAIQRGLDRWEGQQNLRLRFSGHTDDEPLSARSESIYGTNKGLSEVRAERVAKQVSDALDIDLQSMVLVGFGADMPIADNSVAEGRALNRRVTVEATFEVPDTLPEPVVATSANSSAANCIGQTAQLPLTKEGVVWESQEVTETIADKVSEVRFASGKSDISEAAMSDLRRRIDELGTKKNLRVRFIGHTDNERLSDRTASTYGSNQGLSEARARQVAERVQETLGINSNMIEIDGRGDTMPIADNNSTAGRALNRRVDIELVYDETRTDSLVLEKAVKVDSFAASSEPTHGVVRAIEDRTQLDPRLAVVAESAYLTPEAKSVTFYRYSNYPAFVSRFEVNVFRASDIDRTHPIATLSEEPSSQLDVSGSMVWTPQRLRAGEEYVYVLSAIGPDGKSDTTHPRALQILPIDERPADATPVDPMSIYGTTALAQQTIPVNGGRVRVWGLDLAPAHTLTVAGEPMPLDKEGKFVLEAHLPQGTYTLPVVNRNPAGPAMQQDLQLEISDSYLFMVGLANVTFGGNDINNVMEPLSADDRFSGSTFTSGRLGFYLKGKVKGKYLITAQLDSTEDELKDFTDNLQRQDPRSIFRRLEPDQYYPVYGDDSTTRKDTESQGAGYVRVDWDKSKALWGNFDTGITGNEFATYNRSVYGAQLVYKTNSVTSRGENRITLTAFGSEPNSVAARNEFEATGGSLYYLRNTDIVRGSEKVSIEVRRRDTLLVIERIPLQLGKDYEIDHIQGRILLNRPLSQITRNRNDAIIRDRALEGDRVFLIANYEFVPSGFDNDDITAGVRGHVWINSALGLGGTYVNEARAGNDYTLAGGDLSLRYGKGTHLKLEAATSESNQTVSLFSNNGGLTFNTVNIPDASANEGDAYGVEARLNLSDISDQQGVAKVWYKKREAGFSSSRETLQTTDSTDMGFEADLRVSERLKLIARGNEVEFDDQAKDRVLSLQGELRITRKLDVGLEVRDERRDLEVPAAGGGTDTINSDATLIGARVNYAIDEDTSVYVEGQTSTGESAAFESNDLIAVGVKTRMSEALGLGIEASEGDRGSAVVGTVDYRLSDQLALDIGAGFGDGAYGTAGATINLDNGYQLYGSYGIDPDSTVNRQRNVTTIGQRLVLGNGSKLYHEHQWSRARDEDGVTNVFGLDYAVNEYTSISATVQRGELELAGEETNRDAYSLGFAIQRENLRLGSRIEYRRDEGAANDFEQWLSSNALEYKASESLRWLTKANYSKTEDKRSGDDAARLAELSVGAAYRPVWTDRWNMLARYTYLDDLVAPQQVLNRPDQRSHVASVEGLYKQSSRWEFGLKLAIRRGQIRANRDSGQFFDSGLDLAVGRVRYHITHKWDGLVEYRYVANSELDDARSGALIGAYRHLGRRLKFGAGYNFTDYSDDLTNLDYNNGGWFVDLIGKW